MVYKPFVYISLAQFYEKENRCKKNELLVCVQPSVVAALKKLYNTKKCRELFSLFHVNVITKENLFTTKGVIKGQYATVL